MEVIGNILHIYDFVCNNFTTSVTYYTLATITLIFIKYIILKRDFQISNFLAAIKQHIHI